MRFLAELFEFAEDADWDKIFVGKVVFFCCFRFKAVGLNKKWVMTKGGVKVDNLPSWQGETAMQIVPEFRANNFANGSDTWLSI